VPVGRSLHDCEVLTVDEAACGQSGEKGRATRVDRPHLDGGEQPHAIDFTGLLCLRRKRPHGSRAAEQRDEIASFHSLSLVNADQSFCGDVSDGRTRRAQLQAASNRQANDDKSAD
jgi:hypothetical protein